MSAKPAHTRREDMPLGNIQAGRLAALTGVEAKSIAGESLAKLSEKLKWRVDPTLFFFRKICGKVVKKDPVTGVEYPIPFATVYVEDTDCSMISYFPSGSPYGWHYPLLCRREVIGTTTTDACGNFCVLVPRFEIDWILRWRRERICYPVIFTRPNLADLLRDIPQRIPKPWPPGPGPDPGPLDKLAAITPALADVLGGSEAGRLVRDAERLQATRALGSASPGALLDRRLFDRELPPPLPQEFQKVLSGHGVVAAKGASANDGIRAAIAAKVGLQPEHEVLSSFSPRRFIGPFWRCVDIVVPEWQIILDVPDITFRVTQDTNGDGTPETIYTEGFFEVRWDAGNLPDVTLVASSIAKETRFCSPGGPDVNCGNVPAIMTVGFMTVTDPSYFDAVNGYALRPNRPSNNGAITPTPGDLTRPQAQTPFCGSLQFYGCVDVAGAQFYRVLQSVDDGATFSAITGQSWNNYASADGHPIPISADASGWYPVNPIDPVTSNPLARSGLEFPNLILDWWAPDGKNVIKVETGGATKNHLAYSTQLAVDADNAAPSVTYTTLSWKFVGEPDSALRNLLGIPCPTIHRGTTPRDIEVVFEVSVSSAHLRDALIWTGDCGGGSFVFVSGTPSHWHTTASDNAFNLSGRYTLAASALEGAYSFNCNANSRAMNPSGADGGNHLPTPDWNYDPIYVYTRPSLGVAIVNEN